VLIIITTTINLHLFPHNTNISLYVCFSKTHYFFSQYLPTGLSLMQAHCAFCAVQTDSLYISYILVFRWVPGLISDQFIWELWRKKWQWDRLFSEYFGFLPQYHSTKAQSLSSYFYFYHKDKRAKPINFTQSKAICHMGQNWTGENINHVFILQRAKRRSFKYKFMWEISLNMGDKTGELWLECLSV